MPDQHDAFIGSIPENYDQYLGPVIFEPYAIDLVQRLKVSEDSSVLEIACGTGIVTRELRARLPQSVKLVATDLNEAMLAYAARKTGPDEAIAWKQADATALPFADESFEAVICQFGLMFVPDKHRAVREAYRVLKPGGTFLFNVWDEINHNDLPFIAHTTIAGFFAQDPPNFYEIPFCLYEPEIIQALLTEAGFKQIDLQLLSLPCISSSAMHAARGLVEGNPVIGAINERGLSDVSGVIAAVAAAIATRCGDQPVRARMQAYVCSAVR